MIGPGKYDHACTVARMLAQSQAAALIVLQGEQGPGFSIQVAPEFISSLPFVLRYVADAIEKDASEITHPFGK